MDVTHIKFHDGRKCKVPSEKMYSFDDKSILDRYYHDRSIESKQTNEVFEDLGGFALDFTNIIEDFNEIPDIDDKSSRLFTLWAEDEVIGEVVLVLRGIFVLTPYTLSRQIAKNYYLGGEEDDIYYPTAVITVFRTTIVDIDQLERLLDQSLLEIEAQWKILREKAINNLSTNTRLRRRYVNSIDKLIHFTFQIPSIDRETLETLKRKNYRITNFMILLASTTPSYDNATIEYHIKEIQKLYPPQEDRIGS